MKLIRLLATAIAGTAILVLLRRRPRRLRLDRARAAFALAVRGGARYAASAPRLFAAAGAQRQLLREDLAPVQASRPRAAWRRARHAASACPRRTAGLIGK
jgi:hypothetical protein